MENTPESDPATRNEGAKQERLQAMRLICGGMACALVSLRFKAEDINHHNVLSILASVAVGYGVGLYMNNRAD